MTDITNPKWIWIKGGLFLGLALAASVLLVMESASVTVTALLAVSVWASCRFYYFAFYVIGHYVDPTYRFSGLTAFALYALRRGRARASGDQS